MYMEQFEQNLFGNNFAGLPFEALKNALESMNLTMNDMAKRCIDGSSLSETTLDKIGIAVYEAAYYAATGRGACVDIHKYQTFMAENKFYVENLGNVVLGLLTKVATGKTIAEHINNVVRSEYNRIGRTKLFTINPDECAMAPV